mmetsp:Transcript_28381/g.39212  ORF Transcript_28381/g.39212 Transcript_28381/m.39212 type:complete len:278 (-) Transcript_28381:293-1126(-)
MNSTLLKSSKTRIGFVQNIGRNSLRHVNFINSRKYGSHGKNLTLQQNKTRIRCNSKLGKDDIGEEYDGSKEPEVGDLLVDMLKMESGKLKVQAYVDEETENLKKLVDEGKKDLDEVVSANAARSDLEFETAKADLDKQAREVEDMIESVKAMAAEDREKTRLFEEDLDRKLSMNLPFKSLYNNKPRLSKEQQEIVGAEEIEKINAVTRAELGKGWRMMSYGLIALALFGLSLAALEKGSSMAKIMFGGFLLVFLALGAQVVLEQGKALEKGPDDLDS